jgi:hypothetical protein
MTNCVESDIFRPCVETASYKASVFADREGSDNPSEPKEHSRGVLIVPFFVGNRKSSESSCEEI